MGFRVLIVDDEPLARERLRALLADSQVSAAASSGVPGPWQLGEAANAVQAMEQLVHQGWDVVLLDIHMPGMDGLRLAERIRALPRPPAVVFVTAHAEHAVEAFELEAVDYLTKPVRLARLQQALDKAWRWCKLRPAEPAAASSSDADFLLIHDRGRTERVPLDDIVYLKAELKYVTVRTPQRSHIYDGSLHELEHAHGLRWLRIHRNALVARHRIRALEKGLERALDKSAPALTSTEPAEEHDGWWLRLNGVDERLAVSRRQLGAVREALATGAC
jgi:two-component system, LytTR family, response regulator AlgR